MKDDFIKEPFSTSFWISASEPSASPIISRGFEIAKLPKAAKLYVTGLGFFEASVNGESLMGDEYFQPVFSDYERRRFTKISYPCADTFTHRIYYRVFDIAHLLAVGENTLEIQTGGGFYVQNERITEGHMSFADRTKCIYSIKLDDEEINSDGSETWRDSEIVYSNLFIGEVHDPSKKPRHGKVQILPNTESELCEQIGVPDRLIREITPNLLGTANGKSIFDAGENISGLVEVRTRPGYKGKITLRFAENINADLTLDFASAGGGYICASGRKQIMQDTFVCDGTERSFLPKFVWHSFRYFEVEGEFEAVSVKVIHTDAPVSAEFYSDSEALNFLYDAFIRTQLDSMHGSVPSDCPHRERLGYTGDGQICAPSVMMLLDCREFYRKWIIDILDSQDIATGHVQHTAPFQGGGGGPGGWGCAIILVPYYFLRQYGRSEIAFVRRCYEPMKRWLEYLKKHSTDYLVTSEAVGGWCLGDWCTLEKIRLPEPFVNSFYLVKCLGIMCELAELFGEQSDIQTFREWKKNTLHALKRTYFDAERSIYCDGTQGADAYAAAIGLCGAQTAADYYDKLGHFDTGFLGTDVLCEVLFRGGFGEVAYKLLSTEDEGGYLYMKQNGATTLWEHWLGGTSHNHPMFGAPARQIFEGVLGIRQSEGSFGWERVEFTPQLPEKMKYASGSILTPKGRIAVTLTREGGEIKREISLPDGVELVN